MNIEETKIKLKEVQTELNSERKGRMDVEAKLDEEYRRCPVPETPEGKKEMIVSVKDGNWDDPDVMKYMSPKTMVDLSQKILIGIDRVLEVCRELKAEGTTHPMGYISISNIKLKLRNEYDDGILGEILMEILDRNLLLEPVTGYFEFPKEAP